MPTIQQSTKAYEDWLRGQLGDEVVEADLERKHEKMRESPFAFLRATYWRWADTVLENCPDLAGAPPSSPLATFIWKTLALGVTWMGVLCGA